MTPRSTVLLIVVICAIMIALFIAAGCSDTPTSPTPTPVGMDITCPNGRKASEVSQIPCQVCVVCKVG